jgi:hypothetical protein
VEDEANDDDPMETEEDQRAALNKLSKVKKYKISPMALKYLNIEGRAMLGQEGMRELRLKQRADQLKFIAQIHEAVTHFQSEAKTRRQNLQASFANNDKNDGKDTKSVCSWELECSDILPKD